MRELGTITSKMKNNFRDGMPAQHDLNNSSIFEMTYLDQVSA